MSDTAERHPFLTGLSKHRGAPATCLVIFGASGDLASRKLIPALFNLGVDNLLPAEFTLVGYGRKPIADEDVDGYGCGWVVDADGTTVSHDGSWYGTATYLRMNKKTGLTVAVLSNDENAEVVSIGQKIAALFD